MAGGELGGEAGGARGKDGACFTVALGGPAVWAARGGLGPRELCGVRVGEGAWRCEGGAAGRRRARARVGRSESFGASASASTSALRCCTEVDGENCDGVSEHAEHKTDEWPSRQTTAQTGANDGRPKFFGTDEEVVDAETVLSDEVSALARALVKRAAAKKAEVDKDAGRFLGWKSEKTEWTKQTLGVTWWDQAMIKALTDVEKTKHARVMIDIRDARAPRTCSHPLIEKWVQTMNLHRIVVYTHRDLVTQDEIEQIRKWTEENLTVRESIFFKDLRDYKRGSPAMVDDISKRLYDTLLEHGADIGYRQAKKALVCGIPNVGKSSLVYLMAKEMITKMKKKGMYHAPKVANRAGETKNIKVHWFWEKPAMMFVDTPGLFPPRHWVDRDTQNYYKLGITGKINPSDLQKPTEVAEYLLFRLNQARLFEYVSLFRMEGPTDNVKELISAVTKVSKGTPSDKNSVATLLRIFLSGALGRLMLDDLSEPVTPTRAWDWEVLERGAAARQAQRNLLLAHLPGTRTRARDDLEAASWKRMMQGNKAASAGASMHYQKPSVDEVTGELNDIDQELFKRVREERQRRFSRRREGLRDGRREGEVRAVRWSIESELGLPSVMRPDDENKDSSARRAPDIRGVSSGERGRVAPRSRGEFVLDGRGGYGRGAPAELSRSGNDRWANRASSDGASGRGRYFANEQSRYNNGEPSSSVRGNGLQDRLSGRNVRSATESDRGKWEFGKPEAKYGSDVASNDRSRGGDRIQDVRGRGRRSRSDRESGNEDWLLEGISTESRAPIASRSRGGVQPGARRMEAPERRASENGRKSSGTRSDNNSGDFLLADDDKPMVFSSSSPSDVPGRSRPSALGPRESGERNFSGASQKSRSVRVGESDDFEF